MLTVSNIQVIRTGAENVPLFDAPVEFHLPSAGIYLLEGDNQSGKSTLIKVMMGVYSAQSRSAVALTVEGRDYRVTSPYEAMGAGLVAVFQDDQMIPTLTVLEQYQLLFSGKQYGDKSARRTQKQVKEDSLRLLSDYGEQYKAILHKLPTELSGGALAVARLVRAQLVPDARILFLDEAFNAVQSDVWPELIERIKFWRLERSRAVVVVTHNPEEKLAWEAKGCFKVSTKGVKYSEAS